MAERQTFDHALSSFTERVKALGQAADAAQARLDDTVPIVIPETPIERPRSPESQLESAGARLASLKEFLVEMAAIKEQLLSERDKLRQAALGWKETEQVMDRERSQLAEELNKVRERVRDQARRLQETTEAMNRMEALRHESEERMRKALALEAEVRRAQASSPAPGGEENLAFFKRELEEISLRLAASLRAEIEIIESRWRDRLK